MASRLAMVPASDVTTLVGSKLVHTRSSAAPTPLASPCPALAATALAAASACAACGARRRRATGNEAPPAAGARTGAEAAPAAGLSRRRRRHRRQRPKALVRPWPSWPPTWSWSREVARSAGRAAPSLPAPRLPLAPGPRARPRSRAPRRDHAGRVRAGSWPTRAATARGLGRGGGWEHRPATAMTLSKSPSWPPRRAAAARPGSGGTSPRD